ncbi:MAG: GerMN domain-containing protein [Bacillota bacterium]|nr:GerMN domain-containing protein [Bacillota bacterium]
MSRSFWMAFLAVVVLALAVGYGRWGSQYLGRRSPESGRPEPGEQLRQKPPLTAPRQEGEITATLYFSDAQARWLVPEQRRILLRGRSPELAVLEELIAGPRNPRLRRTIPRGARVLAVRTEGGVAYVDWSRELRSQHWGGSAGDLTTIYSIVNTLTRLSHIQQVQLLLEGKKEEAILGHVDTSRPLTPRPELVGRARE